MVILHPHAFQRCDERGATADEVITTVETGETFPAKFDRTGFRHNFLFNSTWNGKYYMTKQIEVFAKKENENWLVITVFVKYF
jgi:hypothetical protein